MRRRGSTLVLVLLVSVVLLVLGLGFLGKQAEQYSGARSVEEAAQARSLALAGLEGARARLSKDLSFPPPGDVDQRIFEYSETFTDLADAPVGTCVVRVDLTYADPPYLLLRLESTGLLGPADKPTARRQLTAEVDLSPAVRGAGGINPNYWQIVNWIDQGSY